MSWNPFKSKKKTIVSSTVYNLAGDTVESFLQGIVFNSIYREEDVQVAKAITTGIRKCPGYRLRNLIYWLKHNSVGKKYQDIIGHNFVEFSASSLNEDALQNAFKSIRLAQLGEGYNIKIDSIEIGGADYSYWGAKYIAENYPEYLEDTYDIEYDFAYNQNKLITIRIYDLTPDPRTGRPPQDPVRVFQIHASSYEKGLKCLYVSYQEYELIRNEDPITHIITYTEPETITAPLKYFIYKNVKSGSSDYNASYAALFPIPKASSSKTFIVPPIPFRLDNKQVSDEDKREAELCKLYKLAKKANTKAFGDNSQYDKVSKNILSNDSIDDIDYCYLVFGTSLNTKNWAGKQYLFYFMKALYELYSSDNITEFFVDDREGKSNFNFKITWSYLKYDIMTIPSWVTFEKSEKYTIVTHDVEYVEEYDDGEGHTSILTKTEKRTFFCYRKSKTSTSCEYIEASGLKHHNYVIDGKTVDTEAKNAFTYEIVDEQPVYKESAFIFPIHEGIFRSLPTLAQAQLSQSYAYLVFNAYVIKKIKWYKRGFFKFIVMAVIIVIVVIITILSWGTAAPEAGSLAATAIAALEAAGLSTMTAMIVTAIAEAIIDMIVAMVVSKLVTKGLTALGVNNVIAQIAGAIAAIITVAGVNGVFNSFGAVAETTTVTEEVVDATGTLVESSTTISESTFTLADSFSKGVFTAFTDASRLCFMAADIANTGYQANIQYKMNQLADRQKELIKVQKQTELLRQKIAELDSKYKDWTKQINVWRIQSSFTPEELQYLSLLTGPEIAHLTTMYPFIMLNLDLP